MRVCTKCGRTWDMEIVACRDCKSPLTTMIDVESTEAPLAPSRGDDLQPDTLVGDYKIDREIGRGGMGTVYGARHPVIGKRAAIKVLDAKLCADHEAVDRFVREAQAVNQIGHANIVDIFAIGVLDDGRSYLVMEWLQGETLMERLARAPMSTQETIAILIALTRALEAAHAAGVIHRDLKPENVFLVPEDETFRVKLLDFGIAKLSTTQPSANRTATGMTVGTPLYMSPEQAKGTAIDGRTDVYSLGILAYAMVCGCTPFETEDSAVEILHAHIRKPPRPPRELSPDLPLSLESLILHMLAKLPEERPDPAEVRQRLKTIRPDGGEFESFTSETPTPLPRARTAEPVGLAVTELSPVTTRLSNNWVVAALGIVALGIVTLALVLSHKGTPSAQDDHPAVAQTPAAAPLPAAAPPPTSPPPTPPTPEIPTVPPVGDLELFVQPATAAVSIDGKSIAVHRGPTHIELSPGEHGVTVSAAGYFAEQQRFQVTASETTPVKIKLRPKPRATKQDTDAVVNPFDRRGTKR